MAQPPDAIRVKMEYEAKVKFMLAGFRATLAAIKTALTTAILLNGGAAIALLAWLGNVYSKNQVIPPVMPALLLFALGVFFSSFATGTAYLAQAKFQVHAKKQLNGNETGDEPKGLQFISISLVGIGYIFFLVGAFLRSAFSPMRHLCRQKLPTNPLVRFR